MDNVGDYLYLKNGGFNLEVDPHLFNLRLHHFSQFPFNVNKSAKGANMWSSPVCLSKCEGSEYTSLSVTKVHYSECNNFKAVGIG